MLLVDGGHDRIRLETLLEDSVCKKMDAVALGCLGLPVQLVRAQLRAANQLPKCAEHQPQQNE